MKQTDHFDLKTGYQNKDTASYWILNDENRILSYRETLNFSVLDMKQDIYNINWE